MKVNMKSYALYQMMTLPMTLNDPDHPKSPHFYILGFFISSVCLKLNFSNFIHRYAITNIILGMTNNPLVLIHTEEY